MGPTGAEIVANLIKIYEEEAHQRLSDLQDALQAQDSSALWRTAHGLKGSSATVGATDLVVLCHELEMLGRQGLLEGAADLVARIQSEAQIAIAELNALDLGDCR